MDKPPTQENKIKKTQAEKDIEWYEKWAIKNTPGYIRIADRREFSKEDVDSFMSLVAEFKTKHSLEALMATTEADDETQKIRMAAKDDLNVINTLLMKFQNETKINQSQFAELQKEYKILSQAIGLLNNGKINHNF